jgi:hypothetical protein
MTIMGRIYTAAVAATLVLATLPALAGQTDKDATSPGQRQHMRGQARHDGPSRAERLLEDRVFVRLAEGAWAGGDFMVKAEDSTVILSGTVPSEAAKQRMLRIAGRTFGVQAVRDQLRVDPTSAMPAAGPTVPDRELAKSVAQQIASTIAGSKAGEDWWLTGWRVEGPDNRWHFTVEAEDGDVWLEGDAPTYRHIRHAVEAARQVSGVRSVRSNLDIDRAYYRYPYGPYSPYPPFATYPSPTPYAYVDPDDIFRDASDRGDARGFQGRHAMTGEVTKIDKQKGTLSLKTLEATLDLHFPPSALEEVDQGDRITVQLGLKPAEAGPAASPRTGPSSSGGQAPGR